MCHLSPYSTQHTPQMNSWFSSIKGDLYTYCEIEKHFQEPVLLPKHHVLVFICPSPIAGSLPSLSVLSLLDYWCFPTGFPFFPCCFSLSYFLHCHYIQKKDTVICLYLLSQNSRMDFSLSYNYKNLNKAFWSLPAFSRQILLHLSHSLRSRPCFLSFLKAPHPFQLL